MDLPKYVRAIKGNALYYDRVVPTRLHSLTPERRIRIPLGLHSDAPPKTIERAAIDAAEEYDARITLLDASDVHMLQDDVVAHGVASLLRNLKVEPGLPQVRMVNLDGSELDDESMRGQGMFAADGSFHSVGTEEESPDYAALVDSMVKTVRAINILHEVEAHPMVKEAAKKALIKGMGKKPPSDAAYALDDLDLNQAAVGGPGRRLYEAVKSYEDGNPVPAMDPGLPPGWDPPVKLMGVPDAYPYLVGQMIATQATDFGNVLSSMGNIGPGYTFHNLAGDVYTYYAGLMQGRVYDRGNGGTVAIPVNEEPRGAAAGTRKQHFMNVFITAVQTVMVDPDQMRTVQGHEAIATTPVQARTDALARGFRDLYDMYGWEVATAIEMFAEAKLVLLSTQIVLHTDKDKYGRPITPPLERLFRPEDWRRLTTPSSDPNNRMSLLDTYLPKGKKFRWIIDPAQPGDDVRAATDAISALMYYLWLIQEHEGASRHGVRFDTLAQGQPGQVMLANKRKYFVQLLKLGLIKVRQRQCTSNGQCMDPPF